ncbi:UbiA prenyltransferase family [Schizophyllum amplum]|uniref:UbiA prenyltransferase family n=1 Tax=Schizophyllum amplum TaxID=97359 RepID=A0A550C2Q7_9AGAR|nr:UbiA prenyltransferase family [Auriculariopsis ampla]
MFDLRRHLYTLFLFTYTDYKTIMLPITVFASVAAPVQSFRGFFLGIIWTWLHQLHIDVSNQYTTLEEDRVNRPWRPLPAKRVTQHQATLLRWALIPITIGFSTLGGPNTIAASVWLSAAFIIYESSAINGHWLGKNVMNCLGYLGFEYGATAMSGEGKSLSPSAALLLLCSGIVILTTVHAQDFSDVEGDRALGRVTFPIRSPGLSRACIYLGVPLWSVLLSCAWDMMWLCRVLFVLLGSVVAWRYYTYRSISQDARSYVIYNVWLFSVHLLPAMQRQAI